MLLLMIKKSVINASISNFVENQITDKTRERSFIHHNKLQTRWHIGILHPLVQWKSHSKLWSAPGNNIIKIVEAMFLRKTENEIFLITHVMYL